MHGNVEVTCGFTQVLDYLLQKIRKTAPIRPIKDKDASKEFLTQKKAQWFTFCPPSLENRSRVR